MWQRCVRLVAYPVLRRTGLNQSPIHATTARFRQFLMCMQSKDISSLVCWVSVKPATTGHTRCWWKRGARQGETGHKVR